MSFNQYVPRFNGNLLDITTDLPDTEDKIPPNNTLADNTLSRDDKLIEEFNWVISASKIYISRELTPEQQQKIQSEYRIKKEKNITSYGSPDYLYRKICIQNCGRNAAINTKCRLYKTNSENVDNLDISSIRFTIPLGETLDLGIYVGHRN